MRGDGHLSIPLGVCSRLTCAALPAKWPGRASRPLPRPGPRRRPGICRPSRPPWAADTRGQPVLGARTLAPVRRRRCGRILRKTNRSVVNRRNRECAQRRSASLTGRVPAGHASHRARTNARTPTCSTPTNSPRWPLRPRRHRSATDRIRADHVARRRATSKARLLSGGRRRPRGLRPRRPDRPSGVADRVRTSISAAGPRTTSGVGCTPAICSSASSHRRPWSSSRVAAERNSCGSTLSTCRAWTAINSGRPG
jgi:hypothetical protein